jgi:hypothetical protein
MSKIRSFLRQLPESLPKPPATVCPKVCPERDLVDCLLVEMRFADPPGNPVSECGSRNKVENS